VNGSVNNNDIVEVGLSRAATCPVVAVLGPKIGFVGCSDIESLAVLGIGAARDVLALLALSNDFGNGDLLVVLSAGAQGCDGSGQEKELLKGSHLDWCKLYRVNERTLSRRVGWIVVCKLS
jgi:hypothetical protein